MLLPAGHLLLRQLFCSHLPTPQLRDPQLPVTQVQPARLRVAMSETSADMAWWRRVLLPAGRLLLRQLFCLQLPTQQLRDPQLLVTQLQPTRLRGATAASSANSPWWRRALLPAGQLQLRQLMCSQLPAPQPRDPQLPVTQVQPTRLRGATAASSADRA